MEEMEKALIEATALPEERIADLVKRRADAVAAFMTKEKQIDASRVQTAQPDAEKRASEKPRAAFEMF